MPDGTESTGQGPTLEDAQSALLGLLSDDSEDQQASETQPEPTKKEKPSSSSQQAPAAPESEAEQADEGSEQAEAEQSDETEQSEDAPPPVRMLKVKADGQELELPEEEVIKGYSRTADYTRKTQQLADDRRKWEESEVAAVRAERHQYHELLGRLESAISELAPTEPDWQKLKDAVSPDVFAQEWTNWHANQKRLEQVRAEKARVSSQEAEDAQKGFKAFVAEQQSKLIAALPDFGDPEKAPAIKRDLSAFAKSRGFTDEELSNVADHRLVILLHDAMQSAKEKDTAKAKAPVVQNKIERAIAPAKPGGSQANNPKPSGLKVAKQRLRETGRVEDGAAAIAHLLD